MATKDTYEVRRHVHVDAPPDEVRPMLTDFHAWQAWSPWEDVDPSMERTYTGPDHGEGATYAWSGNRKAGSGRMTVTDVDDGQVVIDLVFTKPLKAHNTCRFLLAEADGGTDVDWVMSGDRTFLTRVMEVFTSMDKFMGPDFERGLARLKATVEAT